MADKKKSELSVVPEFIDGEQPTAAKLNSIGSLLKREGFILEKSVGDIWGESEPYSSVSQNLLSTPVFKTDSIDNLDDSQDGNGRSLDIVNLGRAIGPMSKLNPKVLLQGLSSGRKSTIREQVPVGVYEYKIKNPVDWTENISFPPADDAFDIRVANLIDLNSEGDYYVDEAKNTVYMYSPTENSAYPFITYVTNPSSWGGGSSYSMSNFNTIPSINQLGYLDLNITQNSSGVYEFSFPTIAYTSRSEDQSASIEQSSVLYGATYTLPASIRAVCGGNYFTENSGITNTAIPEGMIYLKNATTGEIYSDASYYYNNDSSVFVEGVELDLTDTYYFITVGTDITSCIEDLYHKLSEHDHSGSLGENIVSVKELKDNYSEFDNDQKVYFPSTKKGNHFSQYLHRDGYISGDPHNDGNAMRGDLLIGRRSSQPGNYVGSGATYKVSFGTVSSGTVGQYLTKLEDSNNDEYLLIRSSKFSNDVSCSKIELNESGQLKLEATDSMESHAEFGNLMVGGVISKSKTSTLDSEVQGFVNPGQTWFHAKTSNITWTMRNKQVYARNFTQLGGNEESIARESIVNVNGMFLNKTIELPSEIDPSLNSNIISVDIIVSPGESSPALPNPHSIPIDNTRTIYGENTFLGGVNDVRNGYSWKIWQDSPGQTNYLLISVPLDLNGEGGFPHDFLVLDSSGDLFAWLDLTVTITYRNI